MAVSSTAEMIPDTIASPLLNSDAADLHHRRRLEVSWFLRCSISPDEAEAMASPGYRYLPCGGCARMTCDHCNREPSEQVRGGSAGKRASADPRFVSAILSRAALTDPLILKRAMPAMARLPPDERWVLLLDLGAGWSQQEIAARLKVSRSTVGRLRERAIDSLVRLVWG